VDPSIASEHLGWCNAVNLVERSLAIVHGVSVGEESDVQNLPSADALRPAPAAISPTTVRDDDITSERAGGLGLPSGVICAILPGGDEQRAEGIAPSDQ
jgi:hypothetical protein